MTTKTLTITEDAYERLAAIKEESESFTDVINRITGRVSLLSIAGILTEKEAEHLEMNVKRLRTKSHQRSERIAKELADDS